MAAIFQTTFSNGCFLFYENIRISIKSSLKFVSNGQINNSPVLLLGAFYNKSSRCVGVARSDDRNSNWYHTMLVKPERSKNANLRATSWPRECRSHDKVPLYGGVIYHDVTYDTMVKVAESESDIRITTNISPSRASYGVSTVRILEKIDHVTRAPHRIS